MAIAVPGQTERNCVAAASMVSMNAHLFDCLTVILMTEIDDSILDLLQDSWVVDRLLALSHAAAVLLGATLARMLHVQQVPVVVEEIAVEAYGVG